MSHYSIKDLEAISGIKAHTIRIWEQRYGLLEPHRTPTNIRYYDDTQMLRLLNVTTLLENGDKVSMIASYSREEIIDKVEQLVEQQNRNAKGRAAALINKIISAGLTYDEKAFNEAYHLAIESFGLLNTFQEIIYPMLIRVGMMWIKQDLIPAQEHFISNLIKQKLHTAIDNITPPKENAEKWVLLLPEEEDHEIGLLLSSFILRKNGKKVVYLGPRVPVSNMKAVFEKERPQKVHLFMVRNQTTAKAQKLIKQLAKLAKGVQVFISGSSCAYKEVHLPANFEWINSLEDFQSKL